MYVHKVQTCVVRISIIYNYRLVAAANIDLFVPTRIEFVLTMYIAVLDAESSGLTSRTEALS